MSTTVLGLSADHLSHTRSTDELLAAHPRPLTSTRPSSSTSASYDEPDGDNQRWSTWYDVEPLCRGPEPRPDWVVTDRAAVDTELGILKTGKEADVFLLERAVDGGPSVVMAAKRYRDAEHRNFHRNAAYTEGRRGRNSREAGPCRGARPSADRGGRPVGQRRVGVAEALLAGGLPVPYPVQIDGTELLMEWITHDGETAPRLAQTRPEPELLASYFEQLREALAMMAQHGIVHGDLSAYNILAAGERLVIIDLPQVLDLDRQPAGHGLPAARLRQRVRVVPQRGPRPGRGRRARAFGDVLATAF